MKLPPEEPEAGPWRVEPIVEVVRALTEGPRPAGGPAIIAVDGRSSSGKTTLSGRTHELVSRSAVVHTDDVAWHHSIFGWADLLVDGILQPARKGERVSYRPPKWDERGRPGCIEVPEGTDLLIVEGVGAGRAELAPLLDGIVWVQTDLEVLEQRDEARIASEEVSRSVHEIWMAEEIPFLSDDRPWERADVIASGAPDLPHDPLTEIVVSEGPVAPRRSRPRTPPTR